MANGQAVLRHECIKVGPRRSRALFELDGHWRPLDYVANVFHKAGEGTVVDETTGLVWQQSGSDHPVTWHEASAYVSKLNRRTNLFESR